MLLQSPKRKWLANCLKLIEIGAITSETIFSSVTGPKSAKLNVTLKPETPEDKALWKALGPLLNGHDMDSGDRALVITALNSGADVNSLGTASRATPLFVLSQTGEEDLVVAFLERGARVDIETNSIDRGGSGKAVQHAEECIF